MRKTRFSKQASPQMGENQNCPTWVRSPLCQRIVQPLRDTTFNLVNTSYLINVCIRKCIFLARQSEEHFCNTAVSDCNFKVKILSIAVHFQRLVYLGDDVSSTTERSISSSIWRVAFFVSGFLFLLLLLLFMFCTHHFNHLTTPPVPVSCKSKRHGQF